MQKVLHFRHARPPPARGQALAPGIYDLAHARHPAFGALKDITFVPPGVDLTEPAAGMEKIWLEANAWWLDHPKLYPKS